MMSIKKKGRGAGLATFRIRSDSLGALRAFMKLASKSPMLNAIARELSLDLAEGDYHIELLSHIPGVANTLADAASRLYAPEPKEIPATLVNVRRIILEPRGANFWRTFDLPVKASTPRA